MFVVIINYCLNFGFVLLRTNEFLGWLFVGAVALVIFIVRTIVNEPKRKKAKNETENELATTLKELEKNPDNVDLIIKKATAIAYLEGVEKGFKIFDDAILRIPNSGLLYYYRGWLTTQANQNLPKEAYFFYAKAIELGGLDNGELTYAYNMRGQIGHNYNVIGAKADLFKAKSMGSKSAENYIKKWRLKE